MGNRRRQKLEGRLKDLVRQDPQQFLKADPDDLQVVDTVFAGKGLFAARFFEKGEFICNYRRRL